MPPARLRHGAWAASRRNPGRRGVDEDGTLAERPATLRAMKLHAFPSLLQAALALAVAGCAGSSSTGPQDAGAAVQDAATTPLADLNLVQQKIPSVLQGALKAPYALPPHKTCPELSSEVRMLDAALGADLDTPPTISNPGLIERGSNAVGGAANDALHGAAESLVPFRGWVRKLDGAERHSKEVAAAISAGAVRRAYLKGVGQELGCLPPAAPQAASGKPAAPDPSR